MSYTATREMLHATAQRAGDAYAEVRRVAEQVRGLVERIEAAEHEAAESARITALLGADLTDARRRIAELEAAATRDQPKRRKAA